MTHTAIAVVEAKAATSMSYLWDQKLVPPPRADVRLWDIEQRVPLARDADFLRRVWVQLPGHYTGTSWGALWGAVQTVHAIDYARDEVS